MLVVTRRETEKIAFPALGITVHLLRISRKSARVGIDAPPEIKILRDELSPADEARSSNASTPFTAEASAARSEHSLANALNKLILAVHIARKMWESGRHQEADETLQSALKSLEDLDQLQRSLSPVRTCRALIVDDDANERELLAGFLGMNGCECATAADGIDALAYLETGDCPDVVLLDMAMPRCNGPETLRLIRADDRFARVRVFSVSSTSPRDLNVPEGPSGFDAWFPKPLNPRRLWDAIQNAVRVPYNVN